MSQYDVLHILQSLSEPQTSTQIARALHTQRHRPRLSFATASGSSVCADLKKLEKHGLVVRVPIPNVPITGNAPKSRWKAVL